MSPYYDKDGIVLYNADCRDILPELDPATIDLVLTDPPYGINTQTDNHARGRSTTFGGPARDYPPVYGDDVPFDPAHLLRFPRLALFGGNHYASRLPDSPSWIVWDKLGGLTSKRPLGFNNSADGELIWTNLGGPVRFLHHRYIGMNKESEQDQRRLHPTQKPVIVGAYLITHFTQEHELILDPYAGSGSFLVAAKRANRRAIGIEISEAYCDVIVKRLGG